MAAPVFIAASTGATDAAGAWVATCHAPGAAGRIIILQVLQDGATSGAVGFTSATNIENLAGTDNQMTYIGEFAVGSATAAFQHVWIGRSLSTSAPTFTGSNSTSEDTYWRFYEFEYVSTGTTLATVIENVTAGSTVNSVGTSTTVSDASVTTLGRDRLPIQLIGTNDDTISQNSFSGETGGQWEWKAQFASASGTDGSVLLHTGSSKWTANSQGSVTFNDVAYGNGYWVAVGDTGTLYYKATTPDGAWTSNTHGTQGLNAVTYANGYWVTVGNNGTLYYKATDPTGAWTSNPTGSIHNYSVAYGNGYWVVTGFAGNPNVQYRATDPTGVFTGNAQGTETYDAVTYASGYWVVVGSAGSLYYKATDPTGAWTSNTQGTGFNKGIAFGNGYWVTVNSTNTTFFYKQGTDPSGAWTSSTIVGPQKENLIYANGAFVAADSFASGLAFKKATPVGSWSFNSPGVGAMRGIGYGNGYYVAVGNTGVLRYIVDYALDFPGAATVDGGSLTVDLSMAWGALGFALIGTGVDDENILGMLVGMAQPNPDRRSLYV